ncbi:MAG: type II secretion system protein, partial [Planctomycetota bacterium]
MTELMVVVAIIAVLAGILLTAMGGVRRRALSTQTDSTMQEFSKACEAFQIEHNRYPGVIPEQVL